MYKPTPKPMNQEAGDHDDWPLVVETQPTDNQAKHLTEAELRTIQDPDERNGLSGHRAHDNRVKQARSKRS